MPVVLSVKVDDGFAAIVHEKRGELSVSAFLMVCLKAYIEGGERVKEPEPQPEQPAAPSTELLVTVIAWLEHQSKILESNHELQQATYDEQKQLTAVLAQLVAKGITPAPNGNGHAPKASRPTPLPPPEPEPEPASEEDEIDMAAGNFMNAFG